MQTNIEPTPPKKRATKWKSTIEPSGEKAVEVEEKPKRGKVDESLFLQQCVIMLALDIEELDKAK